VGRIETVSSTALLTLPVVLGVIESELRRYRPWYLRRCPLFWA